MSAELPWGALAARPLDEPVPLEQASALLHRLDAPIYVVVRGGALYATARAELVPHGTAGALELRAADGPAQVTRLCRADFLDDHRVRYPYAAGSMTQGIGSAALVLAMARRGHLAFFGSGGLELDTVERNVARLREELDDRHSWGVNLINTPMHTGYEEVMVDLLLRHRVERVEASAYMTITPGLVRYRLHGAHERPDGSVHAPHRIFAKISREELAEQFFSPPPPPMVDALLRAGAIDARAAQVAARLPLAQDVIAEADSAGHTDRRSGLLLFPTLGVLRDQLMARHAYATRLRLGAAGGIATPHTVLAALRLGADFVVTGSINQACVEADTSPFVKQLLAQATMTDVAMAPAADMFEMGVKVQVLTRGLMFHTKARRLEELFQKYASLDELPPDQREFLEGRVFKRPISEIWAETQRYFERVDPRVATKAEQSPKVKMALVFRWYLGLSSRWAREADLSRKVDFQVWCGPAMGAFNRWVKGSELEDPARRSAPELAEQLVEGALLLERIQSLQRMGVPLSPSMTAVRPRPLPR